MIPHGRPMDLRGRSLRVPSACGSRVEAAQSLPEPNVGPDDSDTGRSRSIACIPVQYIHTAYCESLQPASERNPDSHTTLAP